MDTAAAFRASFTAISPNCSAGSVLGRTALPVGSGNPFCNALIKRRQSFSSVKLGSRNLNVLSHKRSGIKASMQPSDSGSSEAPIAPLRLESPVGQFLSQILASHPHLVPAAVEQQLDQLQTDRDADQNEEPSTIGTELVLYRRIAEVKANERRKALEEILYTLVVQKFMDANVPLIPTVTGRVDSVAGEDDKLERLHSPEAYEMIRNHLTLVLGNRTVDPNTIAEISKLRVTQVYAASIMFGYFLKRVDQRFQLEKSMKVISDGADNEEDNFQQIIAEGGPGGAGGGGESSSNAPLHPEVSSWTEDAGDGVFAGIKPSRLRSYVMSFGPETLQRYASIRSKEAVSIIEKHTEALFGRPEISFTPQGTLGSVKDESIKISFGGLKRIVLEAVTFGSFLWDVESYVDSRYHFVAN